MARVSRTAVEIPIEGSDAPIADPADIVRASPFPMALLDADGRLAAVSAAWLLDGVEPAAAAARGLSALAAEPGDALAACLKTGRAELVVERLTGLRRVIFQVQLRREEDGFGVPAILACAADVTAQQLELEEGHRRRGLALRIAGIFWRDIDLTTGELKMLGANPEMQQFYRHDLDTLSHVAAEHRSAVKREVALSIVERRPFHIRYRLNREDGEETYVEVMGEHVYGPSGKPERVFSVIKDVTDVQRAQRRIEKLAFLDGLTGLGNRAHFQREFAAAVVQARLTGEGLGLVMIDVDHFKAVNDTMGHDTGDLLLRSLAGSMERAFREADTLVRLGGDEFAVIVGGVRDEAALQRPIEALRQILAEPVMHDGQSFNISASIGAALSSNVGGEDASALMKNADIALYRAKADGRNRTVMYRPELSSGIADQLATLREVRAGIPRGEFILHYQPLVDTVSGEIQSFEALMRWSHPQRGLLPPSAFHQAFEDADLSLQLGEIALTTAIKQMSQWMEAGVEFGRVAVNVASAQFRSGCFAEEVAAKLRLWKVPPTRLTIEITENVYLGPGSRPVAEAIRALHDMGVLIALDDFGTGYASLSNLRQLAVDKLKIDRSFVQDSDDSVMRAVIGLGSNLGLQVVAEGVETAEQAALLRRHGCDELQGYLYGRAMPASAVTALLAAPPNGTRPASSPAPDPTHTGASRE